MALWGGTGDQGVMGTVPGHKPRSAGRAKVQSSGGGMAPSTAFAKPSWWRSGK